MRRFSVAAMGYPQQVIEAISLMTHEDGVPYMDYVAKIKGNTIARVVKLADLRHNSGLSRLDHADEKSLARAAKYKKAIALLEEKIRSDIMYGAIIGDIVGSKYEFGNFKSKEFPLFSEGCDYTDDTIMTVAVASALLRARNEDGGFKKILVEEMQRFGRAYPHPRGAYGGRFAAWLQSADPQPYGSYGNGSAMRVSPCGLLAVTLEEALELAQASAEVTHDHPEGIKGAKAVAAAVFMARTGAAKEEIREYIEENFYPLDKTLDEIRITYRFDDSCQGTVPQAITAFLESCSFEDAIRNAVSLGGDSDTIGAITGAIAWSFYWGRCFEAPLPEDMKAIRDQAAAMLPEDLLAVVNEFEEIAIHRHTAWLRIALVGKIKI